MSSLDAAAPLDDREVRRLIADACWHNRRAAAGDRVGIELELFPIVVAADGSPAGRLPLAEVADTVTALAADDERMAVRDLSDGTVPSVDLAGGGRLTFEPGGQLEHSTAPLPSVAAALDDADRWGAELASAFAARGTVLAAAGTDIWHSVADQQQTAARYQAMATFFARRGTGWGREMMCHTASLQVNLDLGAADVAEERWIVATLAAPLLVGTFAASPTPVAASGRALAWQHTDPTRTAFPMPLRSGAGVEASVGFALDADVLLIRRGALVEAGTPGWTFGDWLTDGHPRHGRPTADDLAYHLTTLFPEVRVRGFLEIRSVDALPRRHRGVPVALLAGLLYDDRARTSARVVLERLHDRLPELRAQAAVEGLSDPSLCALAVEVWSFALEGARRLPDDAVGDATLRAAEVFLDRFTLRGRCPADELRERFAESPAAALAWACDPVDTVAPLSR